MDSVEVAKAVASLPLTVLLVLVLVGGYVEWWVYGRLYHARIAEKDALIALESARADKWEGRFLELNMKLDTMLHETGRIAHSVNGTATAAAKKLETVEEKLEAVREELWQLKELTNTEVKTTKTVEIKKGEPR